MSEQSDIDRKYMQRALALAADAERKGEVPVGAVIVDPESDSVIAEAANAPISQSDPTAHAEILALRHAATKLSNYRLTGLTLYVTLEPCAMCAGAISHARIARLVYGASDPKGGAVDNGPRFFQQPTCHHRPDITSGILGDDAGKLLKDFFRERRRK